MRKQQDRQLPVYVLTGLAFGGVIAAMSGWMLFSEAAFATSDVAEVKMLPAEVDFMPIEKVVVEGEFRHTDLGRLEKMISVYTSKGFFGVDVDQIERTAREADWVRTASVRRVWPDTLKIFIREHEAFAAWNSNGLISKQGELFYPAEKMDLQTLPVLRGPDGSHEVLLSQYKSILPAFEKLKLKIAELEMDERYAWHLTLENGVDLFFGREQVQESVDRFIEVFGGSFARNMDDVEQIDLRYTNGFAVKWKTKKVLSGESGSVAGRGNS